MATMSRLAPAARQYYNASGEAAVQPPLPQKFISTTPSASPIASENRPPAGFHPWGPLNYARVSRVPRTKGMRYLYADGHITMPIQRLGADGPPNPWISAYQQHLHGPIHNAGFNDLLYQAGYPGWNLGLSFKVPTLPQNQTVPTRGVQKMMNITQKLTRVKRASGAPKGS